MHRLRVVVMLTLVGLLASSVSHAQSAQAPLPPEAQKSLERGLSAISQQEWNLAARYFAEARQAAPWSPLILYNTGLAYAKGDQELPAIAWLQAYLVAMPGAPNAATVRTEIERLKTASQAKIAKIFESATAASKKIGQNNYLIIYWRACAGDIKGAMGMERSEDIFSFWGCYAESLAEAGDFDEAYFALSQIKRDTSDTSNDLADRVRSSSVQSGIDSAWATLTRGLLDQRDVDKAWKTAKQIRDPKQRSQALYNVAYRKVREGDFIPAEEVLPLLQEDDRSRVLDTIVTEQVRAKDFAGALKTARRIQRLTYFKGEALVNIAKAQLEAGDRAGAEASAREALSLGPPGDPEDLERWWEATSGIAYKTGAKANALAGNYNAALALVDRMKGNVAQPYPRDIAYRDISYVQTLRGDIQAAKQTVHVAAGKLKTFEELQKAGKSREDINNIYESGLLSIGCVQSGVAAAQVLQDQIAEVLAIMKECRERAPQTRDVYLDISLPISMAVHRWTKQGKYTEALAAATLFADAASQYPDSEEAGKYTEYLAAIATAQVHVGDFAAAEKTIALLPASSPKYKVKALISVGEAYLKKQAHKDAMRTLAAASQLAMSAKLTDLDLLGTIAALQEKAGDKRGAEAARRNAALAGGVWLDLALKFSQDQALVNWQKALEDAGRTTRADDIPGRIAKVAEALGKGLLKLLAIEKKLARQGQPATAK